MLGGVDIRIATPNAKFGVMEPKRGLFAGGGTTARLPRQIAVPAAMEFLLTAEAFPAEPGARAGPAQRDRRARRAARPGARVGAPHHAPTRRSRCRRRRSRCCGAWPAPSTRPTRSRQELSQADLRHRGRQGGPEGVRREAAAELAGPVSGGRASTRGRRASSASPSGRGTSAGDEQAPEPLAMWRGWSARRPPTPTPRGDVLGASTRLDVVYCQTWQYDDPVGRLAERSASTRATAATRASAARARSSRCAATRPQRSSAGELDVALVVGRRGARHEAPAEEGGGAAGLVAPRPREAAVPVRGAVPPGRGRARGVPGVARPSRCSTSPGAAHLGVEPDDVPAPDRRAVRADDRGRGDEPARVVPARRTRRRARSRRRRTTAWSATRTRSTWSRSWTSTWPPRSSSPATRRPTGSASRPTGACTCAAGVRAPTRPTSPSTPTCGARRRWHAVFARRRSTAPASASTTSPTSTSTRASPRRCTSRCDALGLDRLAIDRPAHRHRRPAVRRRRRQQLPHPLDRDDGRRAARRPRLARARDRRRHAHDQARRPRLYSTDPGGAVRCAARADAARPRRVPIVDHHDGPATVAAYSVVHGRDGSRRRGASPSATSPAAAAATPGSSDPDAARGAGGRGVGRPRRSRCAPTATSTAPALSTDQRRAGSEHQSRGWHLNPVR